MAAAFYCTTLSPPPSRHPAKQPAPRSRHRPNWASISPEINTHILKSVPTSPPPAVADPMHRLISLAPPSVAPALCLAACELVGGRRSEAMNAACAIQLVHAAAHAHEQMLRKEHVVAPGVQLMTGDGMLPLGYQMACEGEDKERALRVVVEITRASGAQGVVEGLLLAAEGRGGPECWAWERRAGRLSACGAACGAIAGGGRVEDVERLRRFGWYVGMMDAMACGGGGGGFGEVSGAFRSLALLELLGFDEGKVDEVVGLFL